MSNRSKRFFEYVLTDNSTIRVNDTLSEWIDAIWTANIPEDAQVDLLGRITHSRNDPHLQIRLLKKLLPTHIMIENFQQWTIFNEDYIDAEESLRSSLAGTKRLRRLIEYGFQQLGPIR